MFNDVLIAELVSPKRTEAGRKVRVTGRKM